MVYLEAAIQGFSLKQSFILGVLVKFPWRLIFSKAAGCTSTVLVEVGSSIGFSQVFVFGELPLVVAS